MHEYASAGVLFRFRNRILPVDIVPNKLQLERISHELTIINFDCTELEIITIILEYMHSGDAMCVACVSVEWHWHLAVCARAEAERRRYG